MPSTLLEHKKHEVTKGMYTIATISFVLLIITNYFDNTIYFIQAISSFFVGGFCLTYLHFSKNYKLPIYVTIILSFFIHFIGFMTDSFVGNQADLLWIMNISILAFYTVGKTWALFYLIVNSTVLMLIKILSSNGIIAPIIEDAPANAASIIAYVVNIVSCMVLFLYMIYKIFKGYEIIQQTVENTNNELKVQHAEKSTMLREIHHRVKNNLQVITSLLRLQIYKIDDEKIKGPFQESINRVSTMALIHAKMYQGDSVNRLDLKSYLEDLSNDLVHIYPTENRVRTEIFSEVKTLDLNDLVPFSLIINELITNSIKHGFKSTEHGVIKIDIRLKDRVIYLTYKDNGVWKAPKNDNSFGLELIETLTEHFEGSFQLNKDNGTEFYFELNLN